MEDNKQEDLDILFLIRGLKKRLLNFFKSIGWLIDFSLRKFAILLCFIVVCSAITLGFKSLQRPYYTAELALIHTRFDNENCRTLVNSINSYISPDAENQTILAQELSLNIDMANMIKSVRYAPLNERLSEKYMDSVHVMLPFKIEVDVYDNSVLDTLENKLLNYLENNKFTLKRKELDRRMIEQTEQKIRQEIIETDSLKNLINKSIIPRGSGNGLIVGEPIDPVSVYKRGLELYERNLTLSRRLALNNSFELIFGFVKKSRPSNHGWLFYVFCGTVIGYTIGILFLLRREYNQKRKQRVP